jgi:hypothetical protein
MFCGEAWNCLVDIRPKDLFARRGSVEEMFDGGVRRGILSAGRGSCQELAAYFRLAREADGHRSGLRGGAACSNQYTLNLGVMWLGQGWRLRELTCTFVCRELGVVIEAWGGGGDAVSKRCA